MDYIGLIGSGCFLNKKYPSIFETEDKDGFRPFNGSGVCLAVMLMLINSRPSRRTPLPDNYFVGKYSKQTYEEDEMYKAAKLLFAVTEDEDIGKFQTIHRYLEEVSKKYNIQNNEKFVNFQERVEKKCNQ